MIPFTGGSWRSQIHRDRKRKAGGPGLGEGHWGWLSRVQGLQDGELWGWRRCWLHKVNVWNAADLYTEERLRWKILCSVCSTTKKKKKKSNMGSALFYKFFSPLEALHLLEGKSAHQLLQ